MDKKRVLIISQAITQDIVDLLQDAIGSCGVIDVITGSPVVSSGTVYMSPRHNSESIVSRLKAWALHFFFIKKWVRSCDKQYDLIYCTSNPPINSYIGLSIKEFFDAKLIYMNWDIYPQVIQETYDIWFVQGICRLWTRWNKRNYPKIDQIITIGDVMLESITKDVSNNIKIKVINLPVDINQLKPIQKMDNEFCQREKIVNKFTVLYSGKMGIGHNIEMILEVAQKMEAYKDITFIFIGEGPKYELVKEYIFANNPTNVRLYPLQPREIFPMSIASGDIGIVSQEKSVAHLFFPSKTISMMACGEAIIGIGSDHDDLYEVIETYNCGLHVTSDDSNVLINAISKLYHDRKLLEKYKRNSRNAAVHYFSRETIVQQYKEMLSELDISL